MLMGVLFGFLLQLGKVTSCNVIENQFRLRDFTVLKVMGTAIVVGGIGVLLLVDTGNTKYYVKDANMLAVALGAALFGVGMVVYGYCPGTALGRHRKRQRACCGRRLRDDRRRRAVCAELRLGEGACAERLGARQGPPARCDGHASISPGLPRSRSAQSAFFYWIESSEARQKR